MFYFFFLGRLILQALTRGGSYLSADDFCFCGGDVSNEIDPKNGGWERELEKLNELLAPRGVSRTCLLFVMSSG